MIDIAEDALAALRQEMRAEFAQMRAEFAHIRARTDGLPLIGAAIETLRHDLRTVRAAINDMARVNITAGEVEALHDDIDRMRSKQLELEARIVTLERGETR